MPTLHEQIQALLNAEKTQEALSLFAQSDYRDAMHLQVQFKTLDYHKSQGLLSTTDWQIMINCIHFALLELTSLEMEAQKIQGKYLFLTQEKQHPTTLLVPPIDSGQKISLHKAAPKIRQALYDGDMSEAISILLRTEEEDALTLCEKFYDIRRAYATGILSLEDRILEFTGLCKEILALHWMQESDQPQIPSAEAKTQMLQLLDEQKIEEALEICSGFGDQYLLVQARFVTLKELFDKGVFYPNSFEKSKKRIKRDLQNLLGQDNPTDDLQTHPFLEIGPAQKLSTHEAAPKIRQAMRAGYTEEAVLLFLRTGAELADLLYKRCFDTAQEYASGLIDADEWGNIQSKICYFILCEPWMRETDSAQTISAQAKSQILDFLERGEIKQALLCCDGFGDDYLLLQRQFEFATKQSSIRPIDSEYLEKFKNRIKYAIRAMFEAPTQNPSDFSTSLTFVLPGLFGELPDQHPPAPIDGQVSTPKVDSSSWLGKIRNYFQ